MGNKTSSSSPTAQHRLRSTTPFHARRDSTCSRRAGLLGEVTTSPCGCSHLPSSSIPPSRPSLTSIRVTAPTGKPLSSARGAPSCSSFGGTRTARPPSLILHPDPPTYQLHH